MIFVLGPSVLAPLAKIFGFRVVVTNHSPDYLCQKWDNLSRFILFRGEMMGTRFAARVIVISSGIKEILKELRYMAVPDGPIIKIKNDPRVHNQLLLFS